MELLKEPILHFAVAGGLLFGAYGLILEDPPEATPAAGVEIGEGELSWLQETFANQWQRPPSRAELEDLLASYLEEELLSREAQALGLDQGDTIVRRRLAQKLDFIVSDTFRLAEPGEEELRRFYSDNAKSFTTASHISFEQRYFSPDRRFDAEGDAAAVLRKISGNAQYARGNDDGDVLFLEGGFMGLDEATLGSLFGAEFAAKVFALEPGIWQGPIASGYGVHLIKVTEIEAGRLPGFEEVREEVLGAWRDAQYRESKALYLASLHQKYGVTIAPSVAPLMGRDLASGAAE